MNRQADITEVYEREFLPMAKYAYGFCSDFQLSQDIASTAFLAFMKKILRGEPINDFRAYLFRSVRNLTINEWRKNSQCISLDVALEIISDGSDSLDLQTEPDVMTFWMMSALEQLPKKQRNIIILRFFNGCNCEETARILGKTVNNIKVTQNLALKNLRKIHEAPMPKKKSEVTETWIIENKDGSIIEFDDIVFGERDEDFDKTMTCYWKGEIVYSGKTKSFSRRDAYEWHQEQLKSRNSP